MKYWHPGSSTWEHWRKRFDLTSEQALERWKTSTETWREPVANKHFEAAVLELEKKDT